MKKDYVQLFDAEIKWCRENIYTSDQHYRIGFMEGLIQAKYLINQYEKNKKSGVEKGIGKINRVRKSKKSGGSKIFGKKAIRTSVR